MTSCSGFKRPVRFGRFHNLDIRTRRPSQHHNRNPPESVKLTGLLIRDVLLGLFPLDCGIRADYFASNAEGFTFWHFDVSKNPGVSFGRAIRVERSPPPKRRHADSICAESDPVKRARVHVDVQISTPLFTHAQTSANKHDALHIYTAFCE